MGLDQRIKALVGALLVAAVLHLGFVIYLEAAGPTPTVPLTAALDKLPMQLGEWAGSDLPPPANIDYADDFVNRRYINTRTGQGISLWCAYSQVGEDRGHHPEVCMKVAGLREDENSRKSFNPEDGKPQTIQEFVFLGPDGAQRVFYWYYRMLPEENRRASDLQLKYQLNHKRPSSMTIEVFAPETQAGHMVDSEAFVKLVDAELQKFVGSTAIRGSSRIPVTVVDEKARDPDH